jgi:hypothetical protein
MRSVFFLLLVCSACSTDRAATPEDGGKRGSSAGGSSGAAGGDSGTTTTLDGSTQGGGCGDPAPTCPSPKPSYASDVVPILEAKCNNCHVGEPGPWPLTDYQSVVDWRIQIIQDIEGCTMPPLDGGTTLSANERHTVLGWLVCGAQKN